MSKIKETDYQLLSQEEQILLRPDTVIGNTGEREDFFYVPVGKTMVKKLIKWSPGFLKIFDEVLTNASDHSQREVGVTEIRVTASESEGLWNFSVWNDGEGIPVVKNREFNLWIPDMVIGRLNSGSNYDDSKSRWGAGRNGIGTGVVSLFSDKFTVNCSDGSRVFYSEILNNCRNRVEPLVKKSSVKPYTSVSWSPDMTRFEVSSPGDMMMLIMRRVYDISAFNPRVNVYFNGELIQIGGFSDWSGMFNGDSVNWGDNYHQISLSLSESGEFWQDSIVNGNTTWRGGTHVDGFINQIIKTILDDKKIGSKIKPSAIKSLLRINLISRIENPSFDTQTKDTLTTKIEVPKLTRGFFKEIYKSDIWLAIEDLIQLSDKKALLSLNKKAAGKRVKIEKLVDAHKAGTKESEKCYLAISEGDSAKGIVLTGIDQIGRDYWGVFPIKGRSLNVRNADTQSISNNEEIKNIIKAIGLVPGKKYQSLSELRYGKIVFFTDADHFGISIKGLLINLFEMLWSELLELGFCFEFITPLVRARRGNQLKDFYDIKKLEAADLTGWKTKYYKGLGTITPPEIKEMFKNIDRHLIRYNYQRNRDSDKLDMIFRKKRADDRKLWMLNTKPEELVKSGKLDIDKFIDNEFIHFSNYDNHISIPHLVDGLKPSQRKSIWVALVKNLTDEVKVAQFGAEVASKTHYNHGENNLFETIIKMAQSHNCSNWLNLFEPVGNFGNRRNPGAWASPRYIYTHLSKWAKLVFKSEDLNILENQNEEGFQIEPKFLIPIVPLILINGANGIGTGWSTSIPNFDPINVIDYLRYKLGENVRNRTISNSWRGWTGKLEESGDKILAKGRLERVKNDYWVKEIPPTKSIDSYLSTLDGLEELGFIKSYTDYSRDDIVNIQIIGLEDTKKLDLVDSIPTSNMNYWVGDKIERGETPYDIIDRWFEIRLDFYIKRKDWVSGELDKKRIRNLNIWKFIDSVINGKLILNSRKLSDLESDLESSNFTKIDGGYNYLLNLPAISFTMEKSGKYKEEYLKTEMEYNEYVKLTPQNIWLGELSELRGELMRNLYNKS